VSAHVDWDGLARRRAPRSGSRARRLHAPSRDSVRDRSSRPRPRTSCENAVKHVLLRYRMLVQWFGCRRLRLRALGHSRLVAFAVVVRLGSSISTRHGRGGALTKLRKRGVLTNWKRVRDERIRLHWSSVLVRFVTHLARVTPRSDSQRQAGHWRLLCECIKSF
jgi:hypothetical protein